MDINDLRGLSTILVMIAFFGVCWWAFAPKRRKKFDEAAQLPFADEAQNKKSVKQQPEPKASAERDSQQK